MASLMHPIRPVVAKPDIEVVTGESEIEDLALRSLVAPRPIEPNGECMKPWVLSPITRCALGSTKYTALTPLKSTLGSTAGKSTRATDVPSSDRDCAIAFTLPGTRTQSFVTRQLNSTRPPETIVHHSEKSVI